MALSVATKATGKGSSTSFTTASIASTTGDLYVMTTTHNSGVPGSLAISGLGITWTLRVQTQVNGTCCVNIWTGLAVGSTAAVTVSWTGTIQFGYEIIAITGSAVPTVFYASSQSAGSHGSPGVWPWPATGPNPTLAMVLVYGIKTANSVTPVWVPDTGEATWTSGTTQTQGTTPPITHTVEWAVGGDSLPRASYTFASGTADSVGAALYVSEGAVAPEMKNMTTLAGAATLANLYTIGAGGYAPQRNIHAGNDRMIIGADTALVSGGPPATYSKGSGRDDTLGSLTVPSLRIRGRAEYGPFYWPVQTGPRSITAKVYYTPDDGAAYRPQLIVRANSQLGVPFDLAVTAPAGADTWHDFDLLDFDVLGTGILHVYFKTRNARLDGGGPVGSGSPPVFANFDALSVT